LVDATTVRLRFQRRRVPIVRRIDHIGIAVLNLDDAMELYDSLLGLKASLVETVEHEGVRAALLPWGDGQLELLESIDSDGPVGKFLERRGEGVHHVCFEVDNVDSEIEELKKKGIQLTRDEARPGLVGMATFVHPRSARGVLVEIVQKA